MKNKKMTNLLSLGESQFIISVCDHPQGEWSQRLVEKAYAPRFRKKFPCEWHNSSYQLGN